MEEIKNNDNIKEKVERIPSERKPIIDYDNHDMTRQSSVRELLKRLIKDKETGEKRDETNKSKKPFKMPGKWKRQMKKSQKAKDQVLLFYLNIKGEMEPPMLQPIYSGNMIIVKNKVYEVDPRAFWIVKDGMKMYKTLLIKEIDRRPVSNLDYSEIRKRGDATDSDEFLIKAALKAFVGQTAKKVSKWVIIAVVGIIVLGVGWFLFSGAGK